jgi:hypothetical protein
MASFEVTTEAITDNRLHVPMHKSSGTIQKRIIGNS